MAEREQVRRSGTEREEEAEEVSTQSAASSDKLKAEIDDILDEIDEVLEDNAEEFVRNYVQKGGE
ncbi:protein of unknown function DUF797 [Acidimicrobium ferrooxidans DSM 10331]|uniref:Prokaryotic ubiquitin-like protein Pup n=1 Tax=Acidimicrobium ferrooxidans (strain DSM 10331 / JCM 15462 / NBRC 103882 / ICP) TaxID=525909 RepID=C7LYP6_ACIFD|nr:ubiquitin-like protein Pup [Acidimicrobium ferrooxidans]ACU53854.1 protein of unknown function DUF797 [Acidimicrobium ferrooxidans DSM 10331]